MSYDYAISSLTILKLELINLACGYVVSFRYTVYDFYEILKNHHKKIKFF